MPYDPTNPMTMRPLASALGQRRMGGIGQRYGSMLTDAGYGGPMPGTPEFQAARAAGQTPIKDWAKDNRGALMEQFQNAGGFAGMGGGTRPMGNPGGSGPIGGPRPMTPPMSPGGYDGSGINPGAPTPMPQRPPMTMGGAPAGFGLPQSPTAPRPMTPGNTGVVPPSMQPQFKR